MPHLAALDTGAGRGVRATGARESVTVGSRGWTFEAPAPPSRQGPAALPAARAPRRPVIAMSKLPEVNAQLRQELFFFGR